MVEKRQQQFKLKNVYSNAFKGVTPQHNMGKTLDKTSIMNDLVKKTSINFNLSYLIIAKTTMLNDEYQVIKETLFQDFKKIK